MKPRRRVFRMAAAASVACAAMLPGAGLAMEDVTVRAGQHDGFGRIVFDLPRAMAYDARIEGSRLEVAFDREIVADLAPVRRLLARHVRDIELRDGKRVVATLTAPHRLRDFVNGESVVVDLVSAGDTAGRLDIGTRFGRHANFTRLVFDWPTTVGYRTKDGDDAFTLRFDRAADIRISPRDVRLARNFEAVSATVSGAGDTEVRLSVNGRVRHFRDGFKVVVDVFDAPAPPPEPVRASEPEPGPEERSAPARAEAAKPDRAPAAGVPIPLVPDTAVDALTIFELAAAPEPRAAAPLVPFAPAVPQPANGIAEIPGDAEALDIEVNAQLDGAIVRFPFENDTGAAVFRRGGRMWIVFDRLVRVDTDLIEAAAREFVSEVEQIPHDAATVIRLTTIPGFNALTLRDGTAWEVLLAPQLPKPEFPLEVTATAGSVPSVIVGPTAPGDPVRIGDPEVGDTIRVVPVLERGEGVVRRHVFPDFRLLVSTQGVAVVPVSDRIDVRAGDDRVIVTAAGGLRLTSADARQRVLANDDDTQVERMFRFVEWRHGELGDFESAKRELIAQIGEAAPEDRNKPRLELARFYLAHGLADRAVGVLDVIAETAPQAERVPSFRALRGASRLLLGDLAGAERDLFERELDTEPEIELWRAAVRGAQGDLFNASLELQSAERFVQEYPDSLRIRFAFLGAELALAINDPVAAEFWLEVVGDAELGPAEQDRRRVYQAGIAAQNGEVDTAVTLYDRTIAGRDRLSRALAGLEKTELLLSEEDITAAEGARALDRLRYVWRGDALEFRILRRLGQLEIASGAFRDGLLTLRRAASNFPEHPDAPTLADEMRAVFARLYLDGESEKLEPVTAIALFDEFRELAPAGAEGDAMIRRLAERLVSVDLLDQATKLLTHQVEFRLEGAEKGAVGARLAMIHLLNRDPGRALEALEMSRTASLGADVRSERALASARAHVLLGNYDRAVSVIGGFTGEEPDLLRAEVFWRQQDWRRAANVFARLAGGLPSGDETLDEKRSRYILNRAVALALGGETNLLAGVARTFGPAMAETPFGPDFRVVTSVSSPARDFAEVLQRVSTVDDFRAFMDNYRARLAGSPEAPAGS